MEIHPFLFLAMDTVTYHHLPIELPKYNEKEQIVAVVFGLRRVFPLFELLSWLLSRGVKQTRRMLQLTRRHLPGSRPLDWELLHWGQPEDV